MQSETPSYNFKNSIRSNPSRIFFIAAFFLLGALFLPAGIAEAAIVPCSGIDCNVCDLYEGVKNIIDFLLFTAVLPLLVISLLAAGVLYLISGGSEKYRTQAKDILWYAVIGTLIAFTGWVIVNTILTTLGFKVPIVGDWNNTAICKQYEELKKTPQPQPGGSIGGGGADGYPQDVLDKQLAEIEGTALKNSSGDLDCASFTPEQQSAISAASQKYGVPESRIKATISRESGGNPNAQSNDNDGKSSYGLMQLRPETVPGASTDQLKDPKFNIDKGTEYYAKLKKTYGSDKLASAGYNGGPAANKPSVNCANEDSLYGGKKRRWECEWDNNEHTLSNKRSGHPGYGGTRDYVPAIDTIEAKFKSGACT